MSDYRELRAQILRVLFDVPDCPDSPEPGRACRHCEAEALTRWIQRTGGTI